VIRALSLPEQNAAAVRGFFLARDNRRVRGARAHLPATRGGFTLPDRKVDHGALSRVVRVFCVALHTALTYLHGARNL
jgi:hypothetical protein